MVDPGVFLLISPQLHELATSNLLLHQFKHCLKNIGQHIMLGFLMEGHKNFNSNKGLGESVIVNKGQSDIRREKRDQIGCKGKQKLQSWLRDARYQSQVAQWIWPQHRVIYSNCMHWQNTIETQAATCTCTFFMAMSRIKTYTLMWVVYWAILSMNFSQVL